MRKPPTSPIIALLFACVAASGQADRTRPVGASRAAAARAPLVVLDSTRERDGLRGPVRRVETDVVRVGLNRGELTEGPPSLLERTLYDERGRRAENETYPVVGNASGQETHSYDAQGNVVETVARDSRGSVLSRITYRYEFDEFDNWTRMTASVAVTKSGKVEYEPVEITRRTITYYHLGGDDAARGTTAGARGPSVAPPEAVRVSGNPRAANESRATAGAKDSRATAAVKETPAASRTPDGSELLNVGVLNERATWLPPPAFPVGRRRLESPVTVAVEVVIDITGRVLSARARGGPAALREPAENAARRATFLPSYVAGRPVGAKGLINYTFNFLP